MASPTASSWSPSTESAKSRPSPSTAPPSSATPTVASSPRPPRPTGGPSRRPRPGPTPRLAGALPLPHHPPPRHLRQAGGRSDQTADGIGAVGAPVVLRGNLSHAASRLSSDDGARPTARRDQLH